jgi:hypothetical protein
MSQRRMSLQEKVTLILHLHDTYDVPLSVLCKSFDLKESTILRYKPKQDQETSK